MGPGEPGAGVTGWRGAGLSGVLTGHLQLGAVAWAVWGLVTEAWEGGGSLSTPCHVAHVSTIASESTSPARLCVFGPGKSSSFPSWNASSTLRFSWVRLLHVLGDGLAHSFLLNGASCDEGNVFYLFCPT